MELINDHSLEFLLENEWALRPYLCFKGQQSLNIKYILN